MHYEPSDFECKCGCGYNEMKMQIPRILNDMYKFIPSCDLPITSACRCKTHNKNVGRAARSYHTKGMAVDLAIGHLSPYYLHHIIDYFIWHFRGMIIYPKRKIIHLDKRQKHMFKVDLS